MNFRIALLVAAGFAALSLYSAPGSAQTPKRGGTLILGVEGEPPNFDCHQSNSIFLLAQVRPVYSNLVRYDQNNFPKVIGDLAESWTVSPDGLTYAFKLHPNVKFHDGSPFTSADVKASFDRIRNPPANVPSIRKSDFVDVASIDTPDPLTVTFKLASPNAAMLDLIANPFNCIYSARKLQENPLYPATTPMGTGAFTHAEYQKGAFGSGKRFEGYFRPGLPYLDGYRTQVMSAGAPINAISAGQIDVVLRGLQPQEINTLKTQLGDRVATDGQVLSLTTIVTPNLRRKPFDDVRVRRAMALAVNHRGDIDSLRKIVNQDSFGGIMRPGYDLALSDAELEKIPGFGRDIDAARAEARRLLAEAGQTGLKVTLLNRNSGTYVPLGIYILSQWQAIGITAQQESLDAAIVIARTTAGDFDVVNDTNSSASDDPTLMLVKYVPGNIQNYGGITDPLLTDLYQKQKVTLDRAQRHGFVSAFEKQVLDQAYILPLFWAGNSPGRRTYVKNWKPTSSFIMGYDMVEVWKDQ